ncbi:carbohydrate ABC transporter permease [Chromohalobacter nigrandesensis]|uniref:carbohydrate ABC transporter permease n=1 Tax=Chromohalobacter nigrandesensis TaxID=119863 RepID=UPI001FF3FD63|nr:carbohydrate ABC transporter permease [Chromohalobacter nigrandesensis]MCK0745331.1 carbohydrate ABC transporter permease [Chromohalobacter nigrandesensis]
MRERTSGRTVGGFRNLFLQGPAVTLLLLWMLVPLGMTLWFSFQRYNLINPMISGFAGWDNYTYLLTDPALWTVMGNTLLLVGWVLAVSVIGGTLLWMLSTKMLPPVGVLMPVYLLFRDMGLLDSPLGLTIVYMLMNLPIVVWMLYTFFKDIPKDILEAGRMDGAGTLQEVLYLLLPLTLPGIASTGLLSVILSWNEAFWSLNLTTSDAAPLTAFIASFSSPEGLFWAKLSAASTLAIAPILIFGWMTQKQMVRGLTFGAVK